MAKPAIFLAGCVLVGCVHSTNHDLTDTEGATGEQLSVRVIVILSKPPVADNKQVTDAISEACQCSPVFVRRYMDSSLIYEISLTQGQTFAAFEKALLASGVSLGIQAVEQDVRMKHQ